MAKTDVIQQNELKRGSSFPDYRLTRKPFMGDVKDQFGDYWIDPLSADYTDLLNEGMETQPYVYKGDEPITTVCYKFYGTTSPWHFILYLNGIMHPQEIPNGKVLNIPTRQALELFFQKVSDRQSQNSVGTIEII